MVSPLGAPLQTPAKRPASVCRSVSPTSPVVLAQDFSSKFALDYFAKPLLFNRSHAMAQQQTQGEAAEYYQNQNQNQNQQQQQYAQPRYSQPPNYGYAPPTQDPTGEKLGFNQTFKIENPKWNDLWAGILFLIVCAGFIAVSGIALQGYSATRSSSGGIYGGSTDFGLTSNTMIMFAFVLGMAFILSNAYVWLARAFPKVCHSPSLPETESRIKRHLRLSSGLQGFSTLSLVWPLQSS